MKTIFLDTSTVVKYFYTIEDNGHTAEKINKAIGISANDSPKERQRKYKRIFLSRFTQLEFISVMMGKYRQDKKHPPKKRPPVTLELVTELIKFFKEEFSKATWIELDYNITWLLGGEETSQSVIGYADEYLMEFSNENNLFAPDSIQLGTAFALFHNGECEYFSTSDNLLRELFKKENLPVF